MLRRFLTVCLPAAVGLSAIVVTLYYQDVRHQRAVQQQEGSYVVALGHEFLALEFQTVCSDLLYLAGQEVLRRLVAGAPDARGILEAEYAGFARSKGIYDQIRFLNTDGQEIVRVNYVAGAAQIVPHDRLQTKATRYYYREALTLEQGEIFVSPFDLNVEHGRIEQPIKPVIRFLTPVCDEAGTPRGLLVLNYLGAHLLAKLQEIAGGFAGQILLLNRSGEYLRASQPEASWGWLLDHSRNFRKEFPEAWAELRGVPTGHCVVNGDLFTFERMSPAFAGRSDRASAGDVGEDASCLLLVSRIPGSVRVAHSSALLKQLLLLSIGALIVVAIPALRWARAGSVREDHERRLAESSARLRLLSVRLLAAQEQERRRISRILHDAVGQQVTAISLDLQSAARGELPGPARALLDRAIEEVDQLLAEIHRLASRVRPSVLDDLGLKDAVESHIAEFQERSGITVHHDLDFRQEQVSPTVCENAYRILQEALSNVAAHARVAETTLILRRDGEHLRMIVRDEGVGFDPEHARVSSRLGLLGMRERVELLGGLFELRSAPGVGTEISVTLPLQDAEQPIDQDEEAPP